MVEFDNGAVDCFAENIISRNIFSQVETDGHDKTIVKQVVDHRVNRKAVTKENGFMKNSNPIEMSEYPVTNRIADAPALVWWVPHVLQKQNQIINNAKGQ